jgi:hypothetical protein
LVVDTAFGLVAAAELLAEAELPVAFEAASA